MQTTSKRIPDQKLIEYQQLLNSQTKQYLSAEKTLKIFSSSDAPMENKAKYAADAERQRELKVKYLSIDKDHACHQWQSEFKLSKTSYVNMETDFPEFILWWLETMKTVMNNWITTNEPAENIAQNMVHLHRLYVHFQTQQKNFSMDENKFYTYMIGSPCTREELTQFILLIQLEHNTDEYELFSKKCDTDDRSSEKNWEEKNKKWQQIHSMWDMLKTYKPAPEVAAPVVTVVEKQVHKNSYFTPQKTPSKKTPAPIGTPTVVSDHTDKEVDLLAKKGNSLDSEIPSVSNALFNFTNIFETSRRELSLRKKDATFQYHAAIRFIDMKLSEDTNSDTEDSTCKSDTEDNTNNSSF